MFEFIFDTEERDGNRKGNGYENDPKRRKYPVTNIVLFSVSINPAQIHQDPAFLFMVSRVLMYLSA